MKALAWGVLLVCGFAFAAPRSPVQWHVKAVQAKAVKAGEPFTVTVAGAIDAGWHLYALEEPEGGPVATEVSITEGDPAELLRVDESKPKTKNDPLFSGPTSYFEAAAEFTLHLRMNRTVTSGAQTLHVLVRYQSCNEHVCLPPHTDMVEVAVETSR